MKKQSFPAREKLRIRLLAIVPAYTAAGLAVMPLLEYILSRSAGRISEWLYLRLDVLYFFYLVIGLSVIFYHYWRKPWDYLDEVINAAQTVYEQNNAAIELSEPLREVEKQMNQIKMSILLSNQALYHTAAVQLKKMQVDLYALLSQVTDELYPALSARGNTARVSAGDGLVVTGDPEKLARVFNNLLKNAAAYSYPDTEISISAEKKGRNAIVVFRNHGQTIPEDKLVHIFEKFSRLDEARLSDTGGAGLGLSIAKEIISLHGGEITAQSNGETVTFTITLPVSD